MKFAISLDIYQGHGLTTYVFHQHLPFMTSIERQRFKYDVNVLLNELQDKCSSIWKFLKFVIYNLLGKAFKM